MNIATIQLLRLNHDKMKAREFDYVVIDEFHRAAARSYRELLALLQPPFLLGLTATPFRSDRQDILSLCSDNILANFELRTGIETGILCPYHYFGCFDNVDYSRIRHNGFRYDVRDLERALLVPERDRAIIGKWHEHAEGKPTIAFCCSHRHAQRMAASFNARHIPAAPYLSSTPIQERERLTNRLVRGKLKILCAVDVLNEGADMPMIECLLFLRPTESKVVFYQQLGRGLRRYVGKSHCTVVDFIGNFRNAYKIVEYQGLLPVADGEGLPGLARVRRAKEILNLPLGCDVEFDERVIDIFADQVNDLRFATRHNIGRILVYQYQRLGKRLGRQPTRRDVERNLFFSELYPLMFGGWREFEKAMKE